MTHKVNPGDQVTCSLHPERGVGTCTCITEGGKICMVYWGEFGVMEGRFYEICSIDKLTKHENVHTEEQEENQDCTNMGQSNG
jgi:hypothetical protein